MKRILVIWTRIIPSRWHRLIITRTADSTCDAAIAMATAATLLGSAKHKTMLRITLRSPLAIAKCKGLRVSPADVRTAEP